MSALSQSIVCPRCQAVLSVRADAPARITCLRCLANVVNPNAVQRETAIPAIPIDNEIRRDLGEARYVLAFLAMFLIFGGMAAAWSGTSILLPLFMILAGIVVAIVASIWSMAVEQRQAAQKREAALLAVPTPRPGSVLEYQPPLDTDIARTPFALQATAGFVAWIIGVILFVQALRASRGSPLYGLTSTPQGGILLVGAMLILFGGLAVWLRVQFKWKGFVPGLLLGLGVTCLLPVGILLVVCGGMLR